MPVDSWVPRDGRGLAAQAPWRPGGSRRLRSGSLQAAAMAGQEDPVQREIHQDWANREYIEVITSSIKKIADFLNSFGQRASRGPRGLGRRPLGQFGEGAEKP